MTLNRRGIMVNADQLNESLERLALPTHANPVAEDGEPIMGFLEMDPESYGLEQQGNTERLQELLARTLDKEIDSLYLRGFLCASGLRPFIKLYTVSPIELPGDDH